MKAPDFIYTNCPVRPYQCNWQACDKSFKRKANCQRHHRTHTNERPFACPVAGCGKSFADQTNLKRHNYIHTNERRFACTFFGCKRRFIQRTSLDIHVQAHTGEKRFKCEEPSCGKVLCDKSSLARHQTIRTKRRHQCSFGGCGKSFCNNAILLEHQQQLHQQGMNPRNIDDGSSASNDQEIPYLQPLSITESLDDMFSISQPDPKYLSNYGTFYHNYESQVHGCHLPPQQSQEYTIPFYETGYPSIHGGESPGMAFYAVDSTPVWSQSYTTPYAPLVPSSTFENGFFLPATLSTDLVVGVQTGVPQYQEPMRSHMVYPQQEQGPYYQLSAF